MNTLPSEGAALARNIINAIGEVPSDVQLILAPPFTHLDRVSGIIADSPVALSAQNCADKEKGAYTGEVSAAMIAATGCSYVILGHSERREYYHETSATLNEKMRLALDNGLSPIFCVGEKLEEREAGRHLGIVEAQIKEVLFNLTADRMARTVVAYEPVWAIGTGKTASAEQAQEIHAFIRRIIQDRFGNLAEDIPILYGGSCKPANARELFAMNDIDGGLIGGASLRAEEFIAIARSF